MFVGPFHFLNLNLCFSVFIHKVFNVYTRRTVKNIPKYAPAQFYIDNVLPRIKEKKIMALKPFVDRLGYEHYGFAWQLTKFSFVFWKIGNEMLLNMF